MITAGPPPASLERQAEPGSLRSIILAAAVHGAFFALIVFGVSWQSRPPAPVEVELWDKLPAPKVSTPAPPPVDVAKPIEPEVEPVKPPDLKAAPPIDKKAPEVKAPPRKDAEIAEKAERQKRERLEKQKAAEAKKREEDDARKKAETEKKKRDDDKRRRDEEVAKRDAQKAKEVAAAQKFEIDGWTGKIKDKIRGRANVPDTVTGNPEVHVLIRLLPGGEVLDMTITKRSGNPAYDGAIERGIRSASPLPVPPASSELFPRFRELNLQIRHER